MVLGQSALLPAPDSQHFVEGEGSVDTYIYVCVCVETQFQTQTAPRTKPYGNGDKETSKQTVKD